MAEEVVLTVKVKEDGGLELVGKKAKKASKNLDSVSKSAATADRQLKGAAKASSNATKNFSKMSQGITGGLVPAYATLAATLFAVSAAFRFFQDAADMRILREGQIEYANSTGIALRSLTKDLQKATEGQLQFREAAASAAIGKAAGLSNEQITRIGKAAKNASISLGRDLTDSFNRLTRGITKAEPELLDELGIILRLETATEKYATAIGKSRLELNAFERSQAVANEVLTQAEEKYGESSVKVNEFNKLAVAMTNTINDMKTALEPLAGFLAGVFSNNITAAFSAVGLFAASMVGSLLPSLDETKNRINQRAAELDVMRKKAIAKTRAYNIAQIREQKRLREAFIQERQNMQLFFDIDDENIKSSKVSENTKKFLRGQSANRQAAMAQLSSQVRKAQSGIYDDTLFRDFHKAGLERFQNTINVMANSYEGKLKQMSNRTSSFVVYATKQFTLLQAGFRTATAKMAFYWSQFLRFVNFATFAIGIIGAISLIYTFAESFVSMFRKVSEEQKKYTEKTNELAESMSGLAKEMSNVFSGAKKLSTLGESLNFASNALGNFNTGDISLALSQDRIAAANRAKRLRDTSFSDLRPDSFSDTGKAISDMFNKAFNEDGKKELEAIEGITDSLSSLLLTMRRAGSMDSDLRIIQELIRAIESGDRIRINSGIESFEKLQVRINSANKASKALNSSLQDYQKALGSIGSGSLAFGSLINPLSNALQQIEAVKVGKLQKVSTEVENIVKAITGEDTVGLDASEASLRRWYDTLISQSQKINEQKIKQMGLESQISLLQQNSTRLVGKEVIRQQLLVNNSKYAELEAEIKINRIAAEKIKNDAAQKELNTQKYNLLVAQREQLETQYTILENQLELWNKIKYSAAESLESSMTTALTNFISATESSLKDLLTNFARDFLTSISKTLAEGLTDTLLSSVGKKFGGGDGMLGTIVSALIPGVGSANGNVLRGGFQAFANGGVVNKPTLGLIGEGKHNEAVVPLPDGRSIPISGAMGNTEINVNINMESGKSSVDQTGSNEQLAQFGKRIGSLVKEEIAKEKRPGGILWSGR